MVWAVSGRYKMLEMSFNPRGAQCPPSVRPTSGYAQRRARGIHHLRITGYTPHVDAIEVGQSRYLDRSKQQYLDTWRRGSLIRVQTVCSVC